MEPSKKKQLFDDPMNYSLISSNSSSAYSPGIVPANPKSTGSLFAMTPTKPQRGKGRIDYSSSGSPSPSLQDQRMEMTPKRSGKMVLDEDGMENDEDFEEDGTVPTAGNGENELDNIDILFAASLSKPSDRELLGDVLYALVGISGTHIKLIRDGTYAVVNPRAELRQRSVCEDAILPIATAYVRVNLFAQYCLQQERGVVSHALGSAIMDVLNEYLMFVAQLEHQFNIGKLTLSSCNCYLQQDPQRTFSVLCRVEDAVTKGKTKGGALINAVYSVREHFRGDARAWKLCDSLVQKATVPYMKMLRQWVCEGDLSHDIYGEFMVEEKEEITKEDLIMDYLNEYWEQKYAFRPSMIPVFLEHYKTKILTAGKYLSVLRECSSKSKNLSILNERVEESDDDDAFDGEGDKDLDDTDEMDDDKESSFVLSEGQKKKKAGKKDEKKDTTKVPIPTVYSENDRELERAVNVAHARASKDLLDLLLGPLRLQEALLSMKHFFLGDQGDFLSQFLEVFSPVLKLKSAEVSSARLNALLDRVFRTSQFDRDMFRDRIRCVYISQSIGMQLVAINGLAVTDDLMLVPGVSPQDEEDPKKLPVMNALAFDCSVDFPLSLVISRGSVAKYQILQRFTLFMRYVESRLNYVWSLHMGSRILNSLLKPLFFVRHKMSMFVKSFLSFVCNEVIEPGWIALTKRIKSALNFDDVLRAHIDFLDSCLLESTLTDLNLIQNATFILNLCLDYAMFAENLDKLLEETLFSASAKAHNSSSSSSQKLLSPSQSPTSLRRSSPTASKSSSPTRNDQASNHIEDMLSAAKEVIDSQSDAINDYNERFNTTFRRFINGLRSYAAGGSTKIGYLISKLDYTNFYSDLPF